MFCPFCSGDVLELHSLIVRPIPQRVIVYEGTIVACGMCSFTSELSLTGVLLDSGRATVEDLEEPGPLPSMFSSTSRESH